MEEQIRIVRPRGAAVRVPCSKCGGDSLMVSPEEAALAAGIPARAVYRWVEEGKIHFRETPQGALEICVASLSEQLKSD